MVLESVLICLDNSEYMRNGDLLPSRLKAQQEAIHHLVSAKLNGHPETIVGIMTMAGDAPEVLVNPCREPAEIMGPVRNQVHLGGRRVRLGKALLTAQLCLKHRPNKVARQRVIVFVGSPLEDSEDGRERLEQLGASLKKNGVAVDVVSFGAENQDNQNPALLRALVDATNDEGNSHLLLVPGEDRLGAAGGGEGGQLMADLVLTSPILLEGGGAVRGGHGAVGGGGGPGAAAGGPAAAAGGGAAGGGGDPIGGGMAFDDDELQQQMELAMRMSMEDEARRQAAAAAAAGGDDGGVKNIDAEAMEDDEEAAAGGGAAEEDEDVEMDFEDDPELAAAIALSMSINNNDSGSPAAAAPATPAAPVAQQQQQAAVAAGAGAGGAQPKDVEDALQDPDFINALVDLLEQDEEDDEGDEGDEE